MKGVSDRRRAAAPSRQRLRELPDQDTKKISASQLAEVLARVDGEPGREPSGPRRTISGPQPIVRPPPEPPELDDVSRVSSAGGPAATLVPSAGGPAATLVSGTAGAIDVPEGQIAVVERPVPQGHVVNATSPLAPRGTDEADVARAPLAKHASWAEDGETKTDVREAAAEAGHRPPPGQSATSPRRSGRLLGIAIVVVSAILAALAAAHSSR